MRRLLVPALLALLICALAASSAAAKAPRSFFSVIPQVGLEDADFTKMKQGRVGTMRFLVPWSSVDEGPGPGNEDWNYLDYQFLNLGQRGIKPLPFIASTPNWVARDLDGRDCDDCSSYYPKSPAALDAWKDFLRLIVGRYGHNGTFWQSHPTAKEPPDAWQLGNEQNSPTYWAPKPDPKQYAKLVKAGAQAIRAEDSKTDIVLGGMFGTPFGDTGTGIAAWTYFTKLYRVKGIKKAFDGVALHPYAGSIKLVRQQSQLSIERIRRAGDGNADLWITEIGWASNGPDRNRLVVGKKGQAKRLRGAYKLFLKRRNAWNVRNVSWYAWRDHQSSSICAWCAYSGLIGEGGGSKPAWKAFKQLARKRS
jgi:hypothetical protein